jgi:hypothetical protein
MRLRPLQDRVLIRRAEWDNASAAALAGERPQAKFWIRVLGLIQRGNR